MKLMLILAFLGAGLGVYLIDKQRLVGGLAGLLAGAVIGFALRTLPRDDPEDGPPMFEDH
jgi:hypothetical protein